MPLFGNTGEDSLARASPDFALKIRKKGKWHHKKIRSSFSGTYKLNVLKRSLPHLQIPVFYANIFLSPVQPEVLGNRVISGLLARCETGCGFPLAVVLCAHGAGSFATIFGKYLTPATSVSFLTDLDLDCEDGCKDVKSIAAEWRGRQRAPLHAARTLLPWTVSRCGRGGIFVHVPGNGSFATVAALTRALSEAINHMELSVGFSEAKGSVDQGPWERLRGHLFLDGTCRDGMSTTMAKACCLPAEGLEMCVLCESGQRFSWCGHRAEHNVGLHI